MKRLLYRLLALMRGISPAEMAAAVVLLLVSAVMIWQLPNQGSRMLELNATVGGSGSSSHWCGDNVCNRANGENSLNCIIDCPLEHCGDLTCQPEEGETMETCANDCGWCGDGTCQNDEDATSCNADCGYCGDDICGALETQESCEEDCDDDLCEGVVCVRINECYFPGECDPRTGQCINRPMPDGTTCSDGFLCTLGDSCSGGSCVPGPPKVCPEEPACKPAKTCSPATGACVVPPNTPNLNGSSCDDTNLCTKNDTCSEETCRGTVDTCDDGNRCTIDSCNPASGCVHTPNTNDPTCGCGNDNCNDHNPCTEDSCFNNSCRNTPLSNTGCADSNVCNGEEVCRSGACAPAPSPMDCDDDNPCTADSCSVAAGGCRNVLIPHCDDCRNNSDCDDSNSCTFDICSNGQCRNPPDNAASCDDGKFCTGIEMCRNGVCNHGAPPICVVSPEDQRNPCKAPPATCDVAEDWCKTPNKPDTTRCMVPGTVTVGRCLSGTCRPLECPNDPGLCEKAGTGVYNPATDRCTYQPDTGASCDDENICTGNGRCTAQKTCNPGAMINCTDNNQCTSDICNIFTGCVHRPIQSPQCDNVCRPANCNDNNPCTSPDACNGTTCSNPAVPDGTVCGDGNTSTPDGVCRGGVCGPAQCTSILACIDDDPCTDDSCNAGICENAFRWNDLSCLLGAYFGNQQQQAPATMSPVTAPTAPQNAVAPQHARPAAGVSGQAPEESEDESTPPTTEPVTADPPTGCTETDQSFCSFIGKTCETMETAPYFHCVGTEEAPPEPTCPENPCDSLRENFCRTVRGGAHCVALDRQPCYTCMGSNTPVEEEETVVEEDASSSEDEQPDNCALGGNIFCLRMQKYCETTDELPGIRCY